MTFSEVKVLKKHLDSGQMVVFAPESNYPAQVTHIKDDIAWLHHGAGVSIAASQLSEFGLVTRLQG